jgi:hypothetical protein
LHPAIMYKFLSSIAANIAKINQYFDWRLVK